MQIYIQHWLNVEKRNKQQKKPLEEKTYPDQKENSEKISINGRRDKKK